MQSTTKSILPDGMTFFFFFFLKISHVFLEHEVSVPSFTAGQTKKWPNLSYTYTYISICYGIGTWYWHVLFSTGGELHHQYRCIPTTNFCHYFWNLQLFETFRIHLQLKLLKSSDSSYRKTFKWAQGQLTDKLHLLLLVWRLRMQ